MNELMNSEIKMTSKEVVDLINEFRAEEGNRKELQHKDFMKSIRKELESLANAGVEVNERNISPVEYIDNKGEKRPCYQMDRSWILQMCNKESALVRYKTQQYIEALEKANLQLDRKQKLQLAILNGDDTQRILALKEYENILTKPLLDKIEEDKPLVEFAETISQASDSIDIGTFSKLVKDQNIKIGRNKLFEWLRDNGYLMKNNVPYQKYIDNNYFEIVEYTYKTSYGEKLTTKTLITGLGQIKIIEKLRKEINN